MIRVVFAVCQYGMYVCFSRGVDFPTNYLLLIVNCLTTIIPPRRTELTLLSVFRRRKLSDQFEQEQFLALCFSVNPNSRWPSSCGVCRHLLDSQNEAEARIQTAHVFGDTLRGVCKALEPKSLADQISSEKSKDLPPGKFSWIAPFRGLDDEYVLNHQSLDGYLYLRFIKMLFVICFVGCCITFPILFPVNATAGGTGKEFDLLSFSNVPSNQKNRYYAHVFVSWIFFSKYKFGRLLLC